MQACWCNTFHLVDEEHKKTINALSVGIKTIQADLLMSTGKVTHSDKKLHAGSLNSNSIFFIGPSKKGRALPTP